MEVLEFGFVWTSCVAIGHLIIIESSLLKNIGTGGRKMPINHDPKQHDMIMDKKVKKQKVAINEAEPIYSFDDVILDEETRDKIEYIISLEENRKLIYDTWGLGRVFNSNRNISVNLYGPSGTGKTMTAHAVAKRLGKKLVIVNYADIESKYVGETSKNLVELFQKAESMDSVLFFDEADALLSKRVTSMNNATDVSVNQTRSVLLQLLDKHKGIVLFTTNFIQNYDSAFYRRITSHIQFKLPSEAIRRLIWEHYIVPELPIKGDRETFIDELVKTDGISGADISTAVFKAAVQTAYLKEWEVKVDRIKAALEEARNLKKIQSDEQYAITTRRVSEQYVKDKIGKDGMIDGIVAES